MTPDIEDILNRTLVSHQWMKRFEQYLRDSVVGQDMLNLLRGVTAVVISAEVRPSFYWAVTGAIYLDADNWLTPVERDTLNEAPDYRAGFGAELQLLCRGAISVVNITLREVIQLTKEQVAVLSTSVIFHG